MPAQTEVNFEDEVLTRANIGRRSTFRRRSVLNISSRFLPNNVDSPRLNIEAVDRRIIHERLEVTEQKKEVANAMEQKAITEFLSCFVQTRRAFLGLFVRFLLAVLVASFFVVVTSQTTNRGLEVVIGNFVHKLCGGAKHVDGWDDVLDSMTEMVQSMFDPTEDGTSFRRIGVYNVFLGVTLTVWPGQEPHKRPFGSDNFPYKTAECLNTPIHGCLEPPIQMWRLGHHALEGAPVRYRGSGLPVSYPPRCDGTQPYGEWDLFNQPDFDRLSHIVGFQDTTSQPHKSIRSGPYQLQPPVERILGHANLTSVLADLEWMRDTKWINDNHTAATALFFFYNAAQGYTEAVSCEWIVRDRDVTVDVEVLDQDGAFQLISSRFSATFCNIPEGDAKVIEHFPNVCIALFVFDILLTLWEMRRHAKWWDSLRQRLLTNTATFLERFFAKLFLPKDLSPPIRSVKGLFFQIVFFLFFLDTRRNANLFFEANSGGGDACADDAMVLADCDALPPSCGVQPCQGLSQEDRLACCRRGMAYDSVYSVISISRTRYFFVVQAAFLVIFLFCSSLMMFPRQNRFGLLQQTVRLSAGHIIHYIIGLLIVIVAFAAAGNILFSHQVDGFGSTSNGIMKLISMLISGELNSNNFETAYPNNQLVAIGFYVLFGLITILILANIFIAIVCEGYIESNEVFDSLRTRCSFQDIQEELQYCRVRKLFSKSPKNNVCKKEAYIQCLNAVKSLEESDERKARASTVEERWDVLRVAVRACRHGSKLTDAQCDRFLCRILRLPRSPRYAATELDTSSRNQQESEISEALSLVPSETSYNSGASVRSEE